MAKRASNIAWNRRASVAGQTYACRCVIVEGPFKAPLAAANSVGLRSIARRVTTVEDAIRMFMINGQCQMSHYAWQKILL
jgi:hypothetical protein